MEFGAAVDNTQAMIDFAGRCARADVAADLVQEFLGLIRRFGFAVGACGGWTGAGRTLAYRFYFSDWPADWTALYEREGFFFDDPLLAEAQRRISPFEWSELGPMSARDHRTIDAAYAYGWVGGIVVPAHGPAGYTGIVSLAANQPFELTSADRVVIWAAALAIHERCRTTLGLGQSSAEAPVLSRREAECLRWVAAGKTDWEIGQLLGISSSTVHFHVERAKKRLSVRNRAQAAALSVLHGVL